MKIQSIWVLLIISTNLPSQEYNGENREITLHPKPGDVSLLLRRNKDDEGLKDIEMNFPDIIVGAQLLNEDNKIPAFSNKNFVLYPRFQKAYIHTIKHPFFPKDEETKALTDSFERAKDRVIRMGKNKKRNKKRFKSLIQSTRSKLELIFKRGIISIFKNVCQSYQIDPSRIKISSLRISAVDGKIRCTAQCKAPYDQTKSHIKDNYSGNSRAVVLNPFTMDITKYLTEKEKQPFLWPARKMQDNFFCFGQKEMETLEKAITARRVTTANSPFKSFLPPATLFLNKEKGLKKGSDIYYHYMEKVENFFDEECDESSPNYKVKKEILTLAKKLLRQQGISRLNEIKKVVLVELELSQLWNDKDLTTAKSILSEKLDNINKKARDLIISFHYYQSAKARNKENQAELEKDYRDKKATFSKAINESLKKLRSSDAKEKAMGKAELSFVSTLFFDLSRAPKSSSARRWGKHLSKKLQSFLSKKKLPKNNSKEKRPYEGKSKKARINP